ncbi:MAG: outer membrane beta-barrel protein [Cytophagales bacterium]|nr:outer membrane beta-barrel protein [Cytophagales bacterium]
MTKNILLVFALLLTGAFSATAQTDRGRVMAGGSVSFNLPTGDGDNVRQSTLSATPSIGFFVADNVALGFGLPITLNRYEDSGARTTIRNSSLAFAPFGRYYFGAANIKPFLEARFGIQRFKNYQSRPAGVTESTDNALFVGMGGGIAFFLNEHVALEPKLTYDAYSRNNTSSAFNFNLGFQVYF